VGIVPSAALAFLTRHNAADYGIMITASHNPPPSNGIKIFNRMGEKLDEATLERLDAMIDAGNPARPWEDFVVSKFASAFKTASKPRVAVDFNNGAGIAVTRNVFKRLNLPYTEANATPTGFNINPNSRAFTGVYDVGFAFDGDADRCLVFDGTGREIGGDVVLAVLAEHLGVKNLVSTVMFNGGIERYLRGKGIKVTRTPVGDRHVLAELDKQRTLTNKKDCIQPQVGGEPSGHYIFPDVLNLDDGLISALMVLKTIVETGKSITELTRGITVWHSKLFNVTDYDGAAGEFKEPNARVLIRKSGTENLTRIYIEAADLEHFEGLVHKYVQKEKSNVM
jgi:phosphoglucosamine mutase